MTFVLVAVDQKGGIFVGGDAAGAPFKTAEEAGVVSAEHYGWINDEGVFGKVHVVELSAYASEDNGA